MLYNAVAAIGQSIIATSLRQQMPRSRSQRLNLKTGSEPKASTVVEFCRSSPSWLLAKLRSIRGFKKLNDPIS